MAAYENRKSGGGSLEPRFPVSGGPRKVGRNIKGDGKEEKGGRKVCTTSLKT